MCCWNLHFDTQEPVMTAEPAPSMHELLGEDPPKNWGKWGDDDEVGALKYLDAAQVLRGIQYVKSGEVFTLQIPMGDPHGDPVFPGRQSYKRENVRYELSLDLGPVGDPD